MQLMELQLSIYVKGYIISIFPEAKSSKYQRWKTKNTTIMSLENVHTICIEMVVDYNHSISVQSELISIVKYA